MLFLAGENATGPRRDSAVTAAAARRILCGAGEAERAMQQLFQRLMTRFRAWYAWRRPTRALPLLIDLGAPIFREVSAHGIRVFSLCGSCGARLEQSATLCDACARRRSESAF